MPFPNEHSCRLKPPGRFDRFARKNCEQKHEGKCIDVIYGITAGESEIQALRYPKDIWNASAARSHCDSRKGSFEAAGSSMEGFMIKSLFVKTEGVYEKIDLSMKDCIKWFEDNTDDEGNIKLDVMMYEECKIKSDKEGMFWTMSDDTLDRDMERFDTAGWNLKTFKMNPVVLWAHNQNRPAIGKVMNPRVKDNELVGRIKFSSAEIDPFAAMIEAKIKEGIISTGSVAFKPMKIELITDEKDPCKLVYRKQDLREFSICNVPSNVNAVYNPEKSVDDKTAILEEGMEFHNPDIEQIQDDIEELKTDVEILKDMQMKQADKKTEVTYFDKLFLKKNESKTNRFNDLFPKK